MTTATEIQPNHDGDGGHRKFGAFLGVFTPSVLTILGVIMYLRFGKVVASAGLGGAIMIVLLCNMISFITGLSASAVATNMAMGAGGEYFLVSRSLGLTVGGAIGIPLFLCRTLSVTLYCFGLAETVEMFWQESWGVLPDLRWIAGGLVVLTTLVAGKSASLALRAQIPLMILVGVSVLALALGVLTGDMQSPEWRQPEQLEEAGGFWAVLALFFPAVTGFTAGIGMSGDLRDPQRTIPRGTIMAIVVGLVTYLIVMVLLGVTATVSGAELLEPRVWTKIAVLGPILVFPGMCSAILSSAFGSALAGPRVLQALAQDGLLPRFLGRTTSTGQPRMATWVAGAIALSAALLLGQLDAVAKLVSIFFLTLYISINMVAATETLVGDPSFRPTLRVPWYVSLVGAVGSLVVIFLISPTACVVALGLELGVYLYLRRRALESHWGDVWAGLWGSLARFALYKFSQQRRSARSWRPTLLIFADQVEQRLGLLRVSSWFNVTRGIMTVCDVITGEAEKEMVEVPRREEEMNAFFREQGVLAFGEVDVVRDFETGVLDIVQANGFGELRSNMIVFGWPSREGRLAAMLSVIRRLRHIDKASALVRAKPATGPRRFERIDVWWRGKQNNGDLMLLLAHMMTLTATWRRATITVHSVVTEQEQVKQMEESLDELLASVRIRAERDVIVKPDDKTIPEIMQETSRDADIVFLGLMTPVENREEEYAQRLEEIVRELPTTVLVRNSGPFEGQLI